MTNNRRRRPTHPGTLLAELLPASPIKNQSNLAKLMGVSRRLINEIINERRLFCLAVSAKKWLRRLINEIINERRPVKPDIAHRLAAVFDTTPDLWLNMQIAIDVWEAAQENHKDYQRIRERAAKIAA